MQNMERSSLTRDDFAKAVGNDIGAQGKKAQEVINELRLKRMHKSSNISDIPESKTLQRGGAKVRRKKKGTRKSSSKRKKTRKREKKSSGKGGKMLNKKLFLKNLHLLGMIAGHGNKKQRDALVNSMNSAQTNVVRKIMEDFLKSRIPVSKVVLRKLKRHKNEILMLSDKKVPWQSRRKAIKQKGGILSTLIPLVAGPLLGGVLKNIL